MRLCPQIPRQLYTTRSEKLVSEMVDFHHCIPHEVSATAGSDGGSDQGFQIPAVELKREQFGKEQG